MLLDYNSTPEFIQQDFRGELKSVTSKAFADDGVKNILNWLERGASIGEHAHIDDYEVMQIVQGVAGSELDGSRDRLGSGMAQYCPKGHPRDLVNVGGGDPAFFAVLPKA